MNDENQIVNILYRYAALIDMGRLEDAAALFVHARIKVHPGDAQDDGTIDGQQLLELWRKKIILYEDGTPRTKHLVTNPIIEIDRSEEHTSELQSLMRNSYAVLC